MTRTSCRSQAFLRHPCEALGTGSSDPGPTETSMTRSRSLIVGLVVLFAIGIGAYVAYDQVLNGDSTPPLALPSSSPDALASAGPTPDASASADPATSGAPAASFDGDVAGTWTVAAGSQAGYRVTEQLASLPAASEAIGRTDQVTGQIVVTSDGT